MYLTIIQNVIYKVCLKSNDHFLICLQATDTISDTFAVLTFVCKPIKCLLQLTILLNVNYTLCFFLCGSFYVKSITTISFQPGHLRFLLNFIHL